MKALLYLNGANFKRAANLQLPSFSLYYVTSDILSKCFEINNIKQKMLDKKYNIIHKYILCSFRGDSFILLSDCRVL